MLAKHGMCCHGSDANSLLKEHQAGHPLGRLVAYELQSFPKCSGSRLPSDKSQLSTPVVVFNQLYSLSLGCSLKASISHDLGCSFAMYGVS